METDEAYALEDLSEEDRGMSSSDDEADVFERFLQKAIKKSQKTNISNFEEEMEKEREKRITNHQRDSGFEVKGSDSLTKPSSTHKTPEEYDKIYFDSDSDEEPETDGHKLGRKFRTNDELLYDPAQDDEDQKWVDKQRRKYLPEKNSSKRTSTKPLPNSDAVLNCPACFNTLCMDCQRHDIYRTQYRAMFVFNCLVDTSHTLRFPESQNSRKNKKTEANLNSEGDSSDVGAAYHSVKCTECNTEVGVIDIEEVYHFFNVVASH